MMQSPELKSFKYKYSRVYEMIEKNIILHNSTDMRVDIFIATLSGPILDEERLDLLRAPWVDDEFIELAKEMGREEIEILGMFPIQRNLSSFFVGDLISRLKLGSPGELSFTSYAC